MYKSWGKFHHRRTGAVGRKRLPTHPRVEPVKQGRINDKALRLSKRLDTEVAASKKQPTPNKPQLRKTIVP